MTPDPSPTTTPQAPALDEGLFCPECGYDLRAMVGERCPECGLVIDRRRVVAGQVPWEQRRVVGRVRAYVNTVMLGTFSIGALAREAGRAVPFADAQRFRWVTVCVAFVPGAVLLPFVLRDLHDNVPLARAVASWTSYGMTQTRRGALDAVMPWGEGWLYWPIGVLALLAFLIGITGVHTYWFHPPGVPVERQNRAIALAYYATAPITWMPIAVVLLAFVLIVTRFTPITRAYMQELALLANFALLLFAFVAPLLLLINLLLLLKRTTRCGVGWIAFAAAGIPLSWLLVVIVSFFVIPWIGGFFALVVNSLR